MAEAGGFFQVIDPKSVNSLNHLEGGLGIHALRIDNLKEATRFGHSLGAPFSVDAVHGATVAQARISRRTP
jgi:hypothetical protein